MGVNNNMSYEAYKKAVLKELQTFGNFKSPDAEAKAYMASDATEERIREHYDQDKDVEGCAWILDMLY